MIAYPSQVSLVRKHLTNADEGRSVRSANFTHQSLYLRLLSQVWLSSLDKGYEESPGSLNSRFAWETQVSVRARKVPQKNIMLCDV